MLAVKIICVGKLRERFYIDAFEEYRKRLSAYCRLECAELTEQRLPEEPSPTQIRAALEGQLFALQLRDETRLQRDVWALAGEDIVLKSAGEQHYSYTYAADAVAGLLTVLLLGADGEAYNVADPSGDIRLKDLAAIAAREAGKKVVFELPDAVEAAGFSKATVARLDGAKLRALGWRARFGIEEGLRRTLAILREST